MSLHDFLKILRQRWIVIVLCTVVAAAVMFAVTPASRDTTPKIGSYTATATLLVGPAEENGVGPASLDRVALLIVTGDVPVSAAESLKYSGTPVLLASGLVVEMDPGSQSITITTTASDGSRAAEVANTFAQESVTYFDGNPPGAPNTALTIQQLASPIPNASTSGFVIPPDRWIRTLLAAALGLLFGLSLALVLDRLDSRLRSRDEVSRDLRLPIVGEVPRLKRGDRVPGTILTVSKPLSVYADGYRAVRTALMHSNITRAGDDAAERATNALAILVSSAHAAEGKTTSVANLAASFAEIGQQVLVIDGDLRNPDLHLKFDVPQGAGVSDYLSDKEHQTLEALVRPTSVSGVDVITAGTKLSEPASLSAHMGPLIAEARRMADVVIIDSAPLLSASDVFDVMPHADTMILVVRSGRLTTNAAQRVSELLGRFRIPVLGAVLIGAPVRKADYGYGYGYGEEQGGSRSVEEITPTPVADTTPAPIVVGQYPDDEVRPSRAR